MVRSISEHSMSSGYEFNIDAEASVFIIGPHPRPSAMLPFPKRDPKREPFPEKSPIEAYPPFIHFHMPITLAVRADKPSSSQLLNTITRIPTCPHVSPFHPFKTT
jgi:hypothetical protein